MSEGLNVLPPGAMVAVSSGSVEWVGRTLAACVALLSGCGTEARGVTECRALETARCEAVVACGYADAAACARFVREQCLHGLFSDVPEPRQLNACLQSLEAAGACVSQAEVGLAAEVRSEDCSPPLPVVGGGAPVCDLLLRPEELRACSGFATPPAAPGALPPQPELRDAG